MPKVNPLPRGRLRLRERHCLEQLITQRSYTSDSTQLSPPEVWYELRLGAPIPLHLHLRLPRSARPCTPNIQWLARPLAQNTSRNSILDAEQLHLLSLSTYIVLTHFLTAGICSASLEPPLRMNSQTHLPSCSLRPQRLLRSFSSNVIIPIRLTLHRVTLRRLILPTCYLV